MSSDPQLPIPCGEIAIRVQGLSKCYKVYDTPKDRLKAFLVPRLQRLVRLTETGYGKEFWALRDISFAIKRGDTVGIIGCNGSGKSTLLQAICGTLTPSLGIVETHGRVAALLELGAGFNPEFTGRENVHMNAALLGLSDREVEERFDSIASFADIGDYLDQPVKTYSSGMYVRLAFAIIAHVDADILIVDEALAVGDAIFTQKCMRFIRRFQQHGTLLFVSHDMSAVQNLCRNAIWLDQGSIRRIGNSKTTAEAYLQYTLQELYGTEVALESTTGNSAPAPVNKTDVREKPPAVDYDTQVAVFNNLPDASGWATGGAELLGIHLESMERDTAAIFSGGERVRMRIRAIAHKELISPIVGFIVKDRLGQDLFGENTLPFTVLSPRTIKQGQEFKAEFIFNLPMLPNGQYAVMASVADGDLHNHIQHHYLHDALIITVASSKIRWGIVGIPFERVSLEAADV